ncbi:SDR family NAD(P)-dependent oxidoreductase [Dyadobacter fermentans]|uniref:Short-chain dehydrogenase/reductase SDR n=1 Tax=Dyadobacter fermentans (strain ATCC 700827 / DSM 18053 / CIP 107007 / KCTC 52180 / NS114) TaxID=471854 RepID=C6W3X7_DYAFD|nr:SDR family NAD(P)-dependent oxidoreductase [Dyadobacter fermentans]ACT95825.1 short-chain dehydrogenase/reductase SDR [Dyadobacter fermentans DSM 18053]
MPKQVIVSGATGNLGKDVVKKLTEFGYGLHINVRKGKTDAYADNANVSSYLADLAHPEQADVFVAEAIANAGKIEAGILLAGGFAMAKLTDTTDSDIEQMLSINFKTAFHVVKPLMKHFEANGGGQFVFIGARPALVAEAGTGSFAYTLSKTLIFQMADLINAEGKSKHITATVIVPSIIDTPDNRAAMPGSDFSKWIPAADMAEGIAFVLSDTGKKLRQTVLKLYNEA